MAVFCLLLCTTLSLLAPGVALGQNPIVTENALPGNPKSEWDVSGSGDPNIQGFATDMSVNKGSTVRFKIDVTGGGTYTIRIYRLGYYQGNGARLIANLGTFTAVNQPEPVTNVTTGWVDCGNWSESATWAVPSTAVSGLYIARLTRSTGSSHIPFVVRDDAGNSPMLFKTSDATWQAYNGYGGSSLYVGTTSYPAGHAVKVSYNRPFVTRDGGAGGGAGEDWFMNAEYPMIRFLERNGYNVSYTTDVDMERSTLPLTPAQHKIFLSVGHDEYWSATARTRIENARAAGVHLAFFSGNEVYWKTRWEDNNRTLVCYKEGTLGEINCGTKCDPNAAWTGLWRDGCAYPGAGACKPENALTGQISWTLSTASITVPGTYRSYRFWRNTSVATQGANQTTTLPNGTLGYEWDYEQYPEAYPNGRIILSSTTLGGLTHKLSLYRHSSGALVFGAGTVQWSWGLDNIHDRGSAAASTIMQQATVNLFADMGVQPGSLMTGLVTATASTDVLAPTTTITSPVHNGTVTANTPLTISGTASDASGVVAGVEVSTDGGNTWVLATGTNTWTYSWTPTSSGTASIRVRGFDDSGNMGVPGAAGTASHITVTVGGGGGTGGGTYTVFQPSTVPQIALENDGSAISLGMKFRTSQNGFITGVRYYKGAGTTGTHTGTLWSSTGTRLAEVVFNNETASGWQQAMFSSPVAVNANTTYVVSYHSSSGDYCSSNPYFTTAVINGPLRGLANGEDGTNGVYLYSSTPSFPTSNYGSSSYFVDVVFTGTTDTAPPTVLSVQPASGATGVSLNSSITAIFSEDMQVGSVNASTVELRDGSNNVLTATVAYNTVTRTVTISPQAALHYSTNYSIRIVGGTSGVKDLAGNALANTFTSGFTTVVDLVAPQVSSVTPAAGATLVGVNVVLSGIFNEPMLASSVSATSILLQSAGGNQVAATVTYNPAYNGFSLIPAGPLQANTVYTATILSGANGVKDAAGNALAANYSWTFATEPEPDLVAPLIVSLTPAPGSTGWAVSGSPQIVFNEDMSASSFTAASVEWRDASNAAVAFTSSYNAATRMLSLTASNPLLNGATYTLLIRGGSNGVKDFSGNSLVSDTSWSFTVVPDLQPPVVNSSTPAEGATGVSLSASVTAQFSEAMGAASINTSTVELRDAASNLLPATVTYNAANRTVTLTPAASLLNNTTYSFIIRSGANGVKDIAGNALQTNYAINFSTVSSSVSIFPSTSTPTAFENDGTPLTLGLKFRSTQAGNILGVRFYKAPGDNGSHVGNLWSATGTKLGEVTFAAETASGWQQAYFTTPVAIAANTTYVVSYFSSSGNYGNSNPSLGTAITNAPLRALANGEDGPNGLYIYGANPSFPTSNYGSSNYFVDVLFGTGPAPDQTAPQVSAVVPANNATAVSLTPDINVTFNEAMSFASISASTLELRTAANQSVPVTISYDAGTRTARLVPSSSLLLNTTYRVVVRSGSTGVKDVAGNALAADYTSSFTTLSDQTPPFIVSTAPQAGATGVSQSTAVTIQFSEPLAAGSVTGTNIFIQGPGAVVLASTLQYNPATNTASLQPQTLLQQGQVYTVHARGSASGISDLAGNTLLADSSWQFTVQPDTDAPFILTTSPVSGSSQVAINSSVVIQFNERIDPANLSTGILQFFADAAPDYGIQWIYDDITKTLTGQPTAPLQYGTVYTVRLIGGQSGIRDLAGNAMAETYLFTFSTRLAPDTQAPQIAVVSPGDQVADVAVNSNMSIQFSEAMDAASVLSSQFTVSVDGTNVLFQVSYSEATNTALLIPQAELLPGKTYQYSVKTGVLRDVAGNLLSLGGTWSFTTTGNNQSDQTAPQVTTVTPDSDAANVSPESVISIRFSERVSTTSLQNGNVTLLGPNNVPQSIFVIHDEATGEEVVIQPRFGLAYGKTYTIQVTGGPTGVTDLAGNPLNENFTSVFTVARDSIAPFVVSFSPANGATNVPLNTVPQIVFNELVEADYKEGKYMMYANGVSVYPYFQQSSGNVVNVLGEQLLNYETTYTITILGGPGGIKDESGNPMAETFTYSFSTGYAPDSIAPTIVSIQPEQNATNVPLNGEISIQFSERIDATTILASDFSLSNQLGNVPFSLSYENSTRTVSLRPLENMLSGTTYNLSIVSGRISDLVGNLLVSGGNWSFTTVTSQVDFVAPVIQSVSPTDGATNVSRLPTILVTFSEAIDAATLTGSNLRLLGPGASVVATAISYDPASFALTMTPLDSLYNDVVYTISVKAGQGGVADVAGNPLEFDFASTFKIIRDTNPPYVVSFSPSNGATGVSVNAIPTIVFSEPVIGNAREGMYRAFANGEETFPYFQEGINEVRLLTESGWQYGTTYTIVILGGSGGVTDNAGNPMAETFSFSFTTETAPDLEAPVVVAVSPSANAVGVPISPTILVSFSEKMNASSITATNVVLRTSSFVEIPATVTYDSANRLASLVPLSPLNLSTNYQVLVRSGAFGVKDLAGNSLASDYSWSFTTVGDLQAPTIVNVTPSNNGINVPISPVVSVEFSEPMDAGSIGAGSFELRNSANVLVAGSISYTAGSRTLSFVPAAALSAGTVYVATVKAGATGVKDLAGNSLLSNYVWSFTTVNPSISIFPPNVVPAVSENDGTALTLGMKFRSTQAGFITGIRYYKAAGSSGVHTGNLWSSTGTKLAEVIFTGETASGWQQMLLNTPVAINANTTYVVSYHSPSGEYVNTNPYFTSAVVNGPLRALANGEDGGNGLYRYTATPQFPNSTYGSSNYFVDVVFSATAGPDLVSPTITSLSPGAGANAVAISATVSATFSETISPTSVTGTVFELRDGLNNPVAATVTVLQNQATLTPQAPLAYSAVYSVRVRGSAAGVLDLAGNPLLRDTTWTFTTVDAPPPPVSGNGPGGPILVLYSTSNPFSRYPIEILRAEGLNYFEAKDIATLNTADLANYDVVLLGEVAVTTAQVTALTNWVNNGGSLIAFRPAAQLAGLLGITRQAGTLADQYLLVNTTAGPGQGIVNQTIQFHGTADLYSLSGASSLATLYSSATTATSNPAVTLRQVGSLGGKAVAFTYDLPRSIVYTRQGNPAWAGQKRDGTSGPIRSDDLFFGGSSPDWVNLNKVAIPQADEQQRLLVNIILQGNLHRKPLPRFWFLPSGHKAAIVMTGDDHANDGTTGRFNQYLTLGPNTAQDVADWKAIRGTSYIYNGTPISNAEAAAFQSQGFEISLHLNTACENYTPVSFNTDLTNQLSLLAGQLPGISAPVTHRTHCLVWSDWATTAKVQAQKGIRLDVNYYYWPGTWVQNRSGMFTGSGMPMRFADLDGTLIDCYQATTQMTDESGIALPQFNDQLLDRALGTEGYYGVFVANMHTDTANHIGSNRIISSALTRNVPVISAKQLLTWLDGRNNSYFGNMTWNNNQLSFPVTALAGARNLRGMVPVQSASGSLTGITRNGQSIAWTIQVIKGMSYAFFDIPVGTSDFVASYGTVATRGIADTIQMAPIVENNIAVAPPVVNQWQVAVSPNPSSTGFNLQVFSPEKGPVSIRIMDITGAVLERHTQVTPGSNIRLGDHWKNGAYYAELTQGTRKTVVKLLKLQ